ncbi:type IV pilus assembly protein PilE [Nonlabens xylanidelens]|uniref:Type IV pilus assembly protein PilE n=1 Tax=Nonlabens xylanidelens TaxID=191564 RepID=A0A2S6IFW3_9FLAO|nr:prepilin-type cleavage/methylation domain-containing protein [Nonlabens xylanidelens]PPK93076.1 type IV pilus assembly protein PilE [Nonlabens xylanidelens]PQJ19625.1 prepilin-type N-terminal cleavage/methylation domain-containing protein [Nonlabens xylanidelens]PQJ23597.1 prepilin-type N-terminal cleavage/methylation domain-containing protein [Nonlabens xylanidelens]
MKFKKNKKHNLKKLKAYTLSEILTVLCIIGILLMLALPSQTPVISQAKAIEAQTMLNYIYGLQKSHFYRYSKYAATLDDLGIEDRPTVDQGGLAVYRIEIISADVDSFVVRAISVSDLDSDGNYNTWEINQLKILKEVVRE